MCAPDKIRSPSHRQNQSPKDFDFVVLREFYEFCTGFALESCNLLQKSPRLSHPPLLCRMNSHSF